VGFCHLLLQLRHYTDVVALYHNQRDALGTALPKVPKKKKRAANVFKQFTPKSVCCFPYRRNVSGSGALKFCGCYNQ